MTDAQWRAWRASKERKMADSDTGGIAVVPPGGHPSPAGALAKGMFVRDSTGLVRKISIWDAFSINMGSIQVGGGWVSLTFILAIFTNADLTVSLILAGIAAGFLALVYVQLVSAMPRSGGDYVFISRLIHPIVGAAIGCGELVFFAVFPGFWATNFVQSNLESFLTTLGSVTGTSGFTTLGNNLGSSHGAELIVAFVYIAILAAIAMWKNTTATKVLVSLVLLQVATLLVGLAILLFASHAHFISEFNSTYGPKNSYNSILALAHHNGYNAGFSLSSSVKALPYAALLIWGFSWAAYPAGELRNAGKNITYSQFAAIGASITLYIAIWVFAKKALGETFLNSVNYLATNYSSKFPLADQPSLGLYASMLTSSGLIKVTVSLIPLFAETALVLTYLMTTSRIIFALSFDRLLPDWLASVNDRTATPIPAIVLTAITIMAIVIISITTSFLAVWSNGTLDLAIVYVVVSLTGAVLPYVKPQLYASSPSVVRGKIAGVPMITIISVLSLLFSLYIVYLAWEQPLVVGPIGWQSVTATIVVFLWGILAFFIARTYWRSHGLDPSLAMAEIPPE